MTDHNIGVDISKSHLDVFRLEDGMIVEHWDVLQDEVPLRTAGGVAMFDPQEARRSVPR